MTTTPQELRRGFARDGCVFPVRAIDAGAAQRIARRILSLDPAQLAPLRYPWRQKAYLLFPELAALARAPRLLATVQQVLGADVAVLSGDLFIKEAQEPRFISWHQDGESWFFEPMNVLTAWVALTEATSENGCMRFAPGTHTSGRVAHRDTYAADNLLSRGQELAVEVDESTALDVELEPGECSLHHCLLAHASGPNRSDRPRVGFAIRFMATEVAQVAGPPISVLPACGQLPRGFTLERAPVRALSPAAIAGHARALAPHEASRFSTV